MINPKPNIFGCFISGPTLIYGFTPKEETEALAQSDTFRSYIWGEKGLDASLKELEHQNYGKNIVLILFEFYIKPLPEETGHMPSIDKYYRKREKSVGIPVIVTEENFFSKSEEERYAFLKRSIMEKLDVLEGIVKQKKLDTDMAKLKAATNKVLYGG